VRGDKYSLRVILSAPRKGILAECFLIRRLEHNFRHCERKRSNLGFENRISTKLVLVLLLRKSKQMDPRKLGKKIKLARVELDLTQTQLAEKSMANRKAFLVMKPGPHYPPYEL